MDRVMSTGGGYFLTYLVAEMAGSISYHRTYDAALRSMVVPVA
jgi:hypothetical protein